MPIAPKIGSGFVAGPNALGEKNTRLHQDILKTKKLLEEQRAARGYTAFVSYRMAALCIEIEEILTKAGIPKPEITFIERGKFGNDLCIKIPALLKELGSKKYITEIVPRLKSIMEESQIVKCGDFTRLSTTGIYLNITASDALLKNLIEDVLQKSNRFGESDTLKNESIVVDYSSPNVAKSLHAGHIRSTILGEVLCNLYEAAGAIVHRLNHVNDLGGFGFYLEGFRRWSNLLPKSENKNTQLAALYRMNRVLEKIYDEARWGDSLQEEERKIISDCFGTGIALEAFRKQYEAYVQASNARFAALEQGDSSEVDLWSQMVSWSLSDFARFYNLLDVHHDYIVGESFYAPTALALLDALKQSGKAVEFTKARVQEALLAVKQSLEREELSPTVAEHLSAEIKKDEGALVILLPCHTRLVVLRSDGRSIYATRDLGAIYYRACHMQPTRVVYVVGQEQQEHFSSLFAAARQVGIDGGAKFDHLYFGFYINATTKKKLSSRDGAADVNRLLIDAVQYFVKKYESRGDIDEAEKQANARELAIGSVIFNDLKKDRKSNVELSNDLEKTYEEFEKAGGAYVMYSACRARSILRKAASEKLQPVTEPTPLQDIEAEIVKKLAAFPQQVATAAQNDDPAAVFSALLDLSRIYNTYYNSFPVAKSGVLYEQRLRLTEAVATVLENGLRFCHIHCPTRI